MYVFLIIIIPTSILSVRAIPLILHHSLHVGFELERQTFVEEMVPIFISVLSQQRDAVDTAPVKNDLSFWRIFDDVPQTPLPILLGSNDG